MKTRTLLLVAVTAGALTSMNALGQFIDSPSALNNAALTASPRAVEMFPQLRPGRLAKISNAKKLPAVATPRAIEEYPNLARGPLDKTAPGDACARICKIARNAAIAASPRTLEEFPELIQGTFCCGEGMRMSTR